MAVIFITDIESAINFWRSKSPSSDDYALPDATRALAEVYARMVVDHASHIEETLLNAPALSAWLAWYDSTPDTPCIAVCSTSQGDEECKGCGRTFEEVQHWLEMDPVAKRQTWHRITQEGRALRFNRYAERAAK